jgi:DNA-binding transcriptional LysR family regulator
MPDRVVGFIGRVNHEGSAHVQEHFDWNGFRFFLAVARAGRLSRASKLLGVDVATVSRNLNHFEASIGARLFERGPDGYSLSDSGRQMMASAEQIEGTILRLPRSLAREARAAQRIRIGVPHGFGDYFLARRIATLCNHYPDISPEILVRSEPYSLAKREVDLSVTLNRPSEGRLLCRKLTDFDMGLYASRSYANLHPPVKTIEDIKDHPVVGMADQSYEVEHCFHAIVPRFRSTSLSAMINAVLGGVGLCILPHFVASQHDGLARILSDSLTIRRGLWLIVHADMKADPGVRAVSSFISSQVDEERSFFLGTTADDRGSIYAGTSRRQAAAAKADCGRA